MEAFLLQAELIRLGISW
jgi:hypothetical protein